MYYSLYKQHVVATISRRISYARRIKITTSFIMVLLERALICFGPGLYAIQGLCNNTLINYTMLLLLLLPVFHLFKTTRTDEY
ncbi:hypothetical protein CPC08DRAFT_410220 [Agrocybe pediades]|nr:hypothetical protein CPC08DRAFT_410220 [Agrocybe pediades]